MKKLILFFAIILSISTFAGNDNSSKCFNESSHLINAGVGLWTGSYYSYGPGGHYYHSPAFSISYEQPWPQRLGPGYLGVGAYVGYEGERYTYDYSYTYNPNSYHYDYRWNHFMITGRATYHWDVLNSSKAEVYAGVLIGLRFNTYQYDDNDPYREDNTTFQKFNPAASVFAGARYYFTKNIGVYGEVGYGISNITAGLTFKL